MEIKSRKMELSWVFIIFLYIFLKVSSNKCFTSSEIGFVFGQILFNPPPLTFAAHLSPFAFFKVSVCYLFDNLESGSKKKLLFCLLLLFCLESVWKVTFSLPSPSSMVKLHLLAERKCAPLIRWRCYNIQMWLLINFILMEFGLFCLLIISRLMSRAIFNFSFQIRCPIMYQELTWWAAPIFLVRGYLQYCKCGTVYFIIQLLIEPDKRNWNLCLLKVSLS